MLESPIFLVNLRRWRPNLNVWRAWTNTNAHKCKKVTNKITFFSSFAYKKIYFKNIYMYLENGKCVCVHTKCVMYEHFHHTYPWYEKRIKFFLFKYYDGQTFKCMLCRFLCFWILKGISFFFFFSLYTLFVLNVKTMLRRSSIWCLMIMFV